jgi:NAD dependent epimerase/dehydratase family enzyme
MARASIPGEIMKKIVIAGGSGFLGRILAAYFQKRGYTITILTRFPKTADNAIREIGWDARTPGDWVRELEEAVAVINLTGRSVNCRYHERNRKLILESRVDSTRVIGQSIAKCKAPPQVWLNSSTATIYKHTFGPAWDESGEIGSAPEAKDEFSIEVATAWERTFNEAQTPATRKVATRTAMVLGRDKNSVFPML